jgi:hypothetical protein
MEDADMSIRLRFFLLASVFLMTLSACKKPMLGFLADTYVNQKDPAQILEVDSKQTLKGFMGGQSVSPIGWFVLWNQEKTTHGEYTLVKDTYTLKSADREFKVVLQKDGSLLDENGVTWVHQTRSRSFRPPDDAVASK